MKPVGLDGPVKIGCSKIPQKRLQEISCWSPWPLEVVGFVPGCYDDEQFLHKCFAKSHSHREWFHSTPALRKMIAAILAAGSISPARSSLMPTGSIRKGRSQITWTEDRRRQASYGHRIRWAISKLRREEETEVVYHTAPRDVSAIMDRWSGNSYRGHPGMPPSDNDLARIHAFLSDPVSQVTEHRISRIRPKSGVAA